MKKVITIIVALCMFVIIFGGMYPALSAETVQLHFKDGDSITGIWSSFYNDVFVIAIGSYGNLHVSIEDVNYLQLDPEFVFSEEYRPGVIFSDDSGRKVLCNHTTKDHYI